MSDLHIDSAFDKRGEAQPIESQFKKNSLQSQNLSDSINAPTFSRLMSGTKSAQKRCWRGSQPNVLQTGNVFWLKLTDLDVPDPRTTRVPDGVYPMFRTAILSGVVACICVMAVEAADSPHAAHMTKCAKVCADCQLQCDACFHHCGTLVADGKKTHAKCMNLCVDCADCCKLCATLCGRQSDLAGPAAECCAKCCEQCAAACEKFPDDEKMTACAKSCRSCAKDCQELVKMMK